MAQDRTATQEDIDELVRFFDEIPAGPAETLVSILTDHGVPVVLGATDKETIQKTAAVHPHAVADAMAYALVVSEILDILGL